MKIIEKALAGLGYVAIAAWLFGAPRSPVFAKDEITFEMAINQALQNSRKLQQSQQDLEGQRAARRSAWAMVGPKVQLAYNDVRYEEAQVLPIGPQPIVMRPKHVQAGSLTVLQPITGAYALVENGVLQGVQTRMKEAALQGVTAEIAFQAATMYLQTSQAERQAKIAKSALEASEAQLKEGLALERVGRIGKGDVLKFRLAVSQAKATVARATAARNIAQAALKQMLGIETVGDLALNGSIPALMTDSEPVDVAVKKALDERPEIRQANLAAESAGFSKKLAYAQFTPQVNIFAKWDKKFGDDDQDPERSFGVQVTWDLWNNGASVFEIQRAVAQTQQAELGALQAADGIKLEVATQKENLVAAADGLAVAEATFEQATEAHRIELAEFRAGKSSASELVTAEFAKNSAEGQLVAAQTDLAVLQLRYQKAIGMVRPKLR